MTSPGFVKRLIWPGLLLVSLTTNLFFTSLYMYQTWRWTVDGSAAVLLWPAQCESASGPSQPCHVCRLGGHSAMPENIFSNGYLLFADAWWKNRCQLADFQQLTSHFNGAMKKLYGQIRNHISLNLWFMIAWKCFGFFDLALFCLLVCHCSSYMKTGAYVIDLKISSVALMHDGFFKTIVWNVQ